MGIWLDFFAQAFVNALAWVSAVTVVYFTLAAVLVRLCRRPAGSSREPDQ
ncbi:hypothetical protein GVN24_24630 [Rhizobium sp. CRIBSB]|nr:hypothetical protein [Rhizobium sp. CRIBSB]